MATLAVRNQNPGNLRDTTTGNFRSFSDPVEGKAALYNDLTAKMTGNSRTGLTPTSTILDFAKTYAPEGDNNDPVNYAANIANKMGISPDTKIGELLPRIDDFASAVASNEDASAKYQQHQPIKTNTQTNQYNPTPFSSPGAIDFSGLPPVTQEKPKVEGEQGFLQDLGGHLLDRTNQAGKALTDATSGKMSVPLISAPLQVTGAVAGALGDVVNTSLEHTPILGKVLKTVEGWVGKGAESFFKTEAGQSVANALGEFQTQHPEASDNLGAAFDIATAWPILKGLGAVKNIAGETIVNIVKNRAKNIAVKSVTKDIKSVLGRTIAGRELLQNVPGGVEILIKNGAIPTFTTAGGVVKYDTKNAFEIMSKAISDIDNNELLPALQRASTEKVAERMTLSSVEKIAKQIATEELHDTKAVTNVIKLIKAKYGEYPSLLQLNEAKRTISKQITKAAFGSPNYSTNVIIRKALRQSIEEGATKMGLADVKAINQRMADLIRAQDMLKLINNRTVQSSTGLASLAKSAITGTGAAVGTAVGGNTFTGGLIGHELSGAISGRMAGGVRRKIAYSALRATAPAPNKLSKLGGLLGAAMAQKTQSSR